MILYVMKHTNKARIELYSNRCHNNRDVINYKMDYEQTPTYDKNVILL